MTHLDALGLFWILVCWHGLADYALQSPLMAEYKNKWAAETHPDVPWYWWMTSHCLIHALGVSFFCNPLLGVCEFVMHFFFDMSKCAVVQTLNQDQCMHIVCKALWAMIMLMLLAE